MDAKLDAWRCGESKDDDLHVDFTIRRKVGSLQENPIMDNRGSK